MRDMDIMTTKCGDYSIGYSYLGKVVHYTNVETMLKSYALVEKNLYIRDWSISGPELFRLPREFLL